MAARKNIVLRSLEYQINEIVGKQFEEIVNQVEETIREEAPELKSKDPRLADKKGALKKSITKEKKSEKRYLVGVDGDKLKSMTGTDYSPYVAKGTKPHTIEAKGNALKFMSGGGYAYAKKVRHPGTKANDFIGRAIKKLK